MMSKRQQKKGVVIQNNIPKTLVVKVTHIKQHPIYGKRIVRGKKYFVDAKEKVKVGKNVLIEECRPISKKKRWRLVQILDKENN
jgi:small subunit ribosomal protein S17